MIFLISVIGMLDVIKNYFGISFKCSYVIVIVLFFVTIWRIIEYRNYRRLELSIFVQSLNPQN